MYRNGVQLPPIRLTPNPPMLGIPSIPRNPGSPVEKEKCFLYSIKEIFNTKNFIARTASHSTHSTKSWAVYSHTFKPKR